MLPASEIPLSIDVPTNVGVRAVAIVVP